jgi:RNA polymerase sigma-70 factor (ECF subfamily)
VTIRYHIPDHERPPGASEGADPRIAHSSPGEGAIMIVATGRRDDSSVPRLDRPRHDEADAYDVPSRADERALIARIRTGDPGAFEQLFRAYYNPLCVFVSCYVSSPDLAEELVEAVLVRIWEQRSRWEVRGSLTAYLYAAARYQVLDHRRHAAVESRMRARAAREGLSPGMGQARHAADASCEVDELADAISEAITHLPGKCRRIFILRWQHHLSYAEIAATLGIATKTVETQLNRANRALRERLRPYW